MRSPSQRGALWFQVPSGSCGIVKMANEGLLEYVHGQFEDASVGRLPLHVRMTYCASPKSPLSPQGEEDETARAGACAEARTPGDLSSTPHAVWEGSVGSHKKLQ